MKARTLLFHFSLFISGLSFAQQHEIDSIRHVLATTQVHEDTVRAKTIGMLASVYSEAETDTAVLYFNQAIALANKLKWERGVAYLSFFLGDLYYDTGNFTGALACHKRSLEIRTSLGNKEGMLACNHGIGNIYFKQGIYNKAIEHYFKAMRLAEELGNKIGIASAWSNIGNVYLKQRNSKEAVECYLKGLKISESIGDKKGIANKYGNIAGTYNADKQFAMALIYYNKALQLFEEMKDKAGIARTYSNMANVYASQGDSAVFYNNNTYAFEVMYPRALDLFQKNLRIAEEQGDQYSVAYRLMSIGQVLNSMHKYKEAYEYLKKALELSKKINALDLTIDIYENISIFYDKTGDGKQALLWYKRFVGLRDSIYSEENRKEGIRAELNFEFEKKEAVAKEAAAAAAALAAAENKKQKVISLAVAGGLIFVLIFAAFIFRSLRIARKQKQIIEEKKEIIEAKNKDITDSINYAQRIQQAKLPPLQSISSELPQSFVLFKPKDIVSGDFYFFHKGSSRIFLAAADCTGHGVPGALMSMIGSELLNDAVEMYQSPSDILKQVNKRIKVSLRQSESEDSTRDGMDIAFCTLDPGKKSLEFSGANRPLWLVRKGATEVEEVKGTKKAIGGLTGDEQHFDLHKLELNSGDTFYICTDGFADMFSGDGKKKLTTRKFKELLLTIQTKSMREQEKHLEEFAAGWMGSTEAVDDILVIGVRV